MKSTFLRVVAKMAEKTVHTANQTACIAWTYQPKAPKKLERYRKVK